MASSVSAIIKLNQESIAMLEAKHYSKAASLLNKAVAGLKQVLACDSSQTMTCENLTFSFDQTWSKTVEEVTDNDDPFIFETPIRVTAVDTEDANLEVKSVMSTHQTLKMLSFALVFNLAIAFHLGSLYHKSPTTTLLKTKKRLLKALAFYKLATTMLDTFDCHTPAGIMEAVALANNQGHVYRVLHEQEQADACYQKVVSYIMYATDVGQADGILRFQHFFATAITKLAPTANAA